MLWGFCPRTAKEKRKRRIKGGIFILERGRGLTYPPGIHHITGHELISHIYGWEQGYGKNINESAVSGQC